MAHKYNLESSEVLLKEVFRDSQLTYINSYVQSLIDTEDFSNFSKFTKNVIISNFKGFMNRLIAQIWSNFSGNESKPELFFSPMTVVLSYQLTLIKQNLLAKNVLNDLMSEQEMKRKLNDFFHDYENRAEFKKVTTEYLSLKQDFDTIAELAKSYKSCGSEMISSAKYLIEIYLRYKEVIFKGMGFDVALEFYNVENFNFIYRDARLQNEEERKIYENIAMNAAIKAAMPGFNGDISEFANIKI